MTDREQAREHSKRNHLDLYGDIAAGKGQARDNWEPCERKDAEQYRTRRSIACSIALAKDSDFGAWSDWYTGKGELIFGNVETEYQRRKQPGPAAGDALELAQEVARIRLDSIGRVEMGAGLIRLAQKYGIWYGDDVPRLDLPSLRGQPAPAAGDEQDDGIVCAECRAMLSRSYIEQGFGLCERCANTQPEPEQPKATT